MIWLLAGIGVLVVVCLVGAVVLAIRPSRRDWP